MYQKSLYNSCAHVICIKVDDTQTCSIPDAFKTHIINVVE